MSILDPAKAQEIKELIRPYYLKWVYSKLFPKRYPNYFRSCWSYPRASLSDPPEKGDVLFLPAADMHSRTQRTEHFATTLADRGFRCFYLNPHLGREFPQPYLFSHGMRINEIRPRLYEIHVHLPREPVYHHRRLSTDENTLIVDSLCEILRRFHTGRLAIISSFPLWLEVAVGLRSAWGCSVIYDCHDLWRAFGNIDPSILSDEDKCFDLSDGILFSAEALMSSATRSNFGRAAKSVLVRNAAGPMWFGMDRTGVSKEILTIGYVGSMSSWLDFGMIDAAASRHSEWRFILIGRIESPEAAKLAQFANVQMPGEIPYSELPRYISQFNVAIIPFRLTPLTLMTNPIKLYEYLACGLPVVSSALPEVMPFSDVVYIAQDQNDFVTQLERALSEPESLKAARRAAVRGETWIDRCLQIEPLLSTSGRSSAVVIDKELLDGHR